MVEEEEEVLGKYRKINGAKKMESGEGRRG